MRIFQEIAYISLKIRAIRVGVIINKMCVFTIQETFVLSSICQKCQGTQIKVRLPGAEKGKFVVVRLG